jgi:predicted phosphodiesterase
VASKCDALPLPIRQRIADLRSRGYGAGKIHGMIPELGQRNISGPTLEKWITRSDTMPQPDPDKLDRIADLLAANGVDLADVGAIESIRLSEWEGGKGGAMRRAASVVLSPGWAEGPRWPLVAPGKPVKLPPRAAGKLTQSNWLTAAIIPDVQIGYRRSLDAATLDPFHDEAAMAAAIRVVRASRPNLVVILGDFLDLAPMGRFEQEPGFALTVQPALDRATMYLAELRAAAPLDCQFVMLEGNHDRRLTKAIVNNAVAAFGLRPGYTAPDTWPDLSVPHLLRFDELGVAYVDGYPAGTFWINENLACIHGHRIKAAGSTAALVMDDARVSFLFGHVHRIELIHRTRQVYDGQKRSLAATLGCLCRTDGTVPSLKGSTDVFGRPVPSVENWQHGVGVVTYEAAGAQRFQLELVAIQDGTVLFRGKELT